MERHQNGMDVWVGKGIFYLLYNNVAILFLLQNTGATSVRNYSLKENIETAEIH